MTVSPTPTQGFGAVAATGLLAQGVGGALAIVFVWYFHAAHPDVTPPPEAVEQALSLIFTTAVSGIAMLLHCVLRKLNFTPD